MVNIVHDFIFDFIDYIFIYVLLFYVIYFVKICCKLCWKLLGWILTNLEKVKIFLESCNFVEKFVHIYVE